MKFEEMQRFSRPLVWIPMVIVLVLSSIAMYVQLIQGEPIGNNPVPDAALVVIAVSVLLTFVLLVSFSIHTFIDTNGLSLRVSPLGIKRNWPWSEVKIAEVKDYGFVGGWGIRLWTSHGTVYNVSGSKGLAVVLMGGKKFVIGTQVPEKLKTAIEKLGPQKAASL